MKRQFFTLFLSLLLSGCGGGGGSSSSGGSSSKKPQSCAITNGSGHKVWDKTAKKYSTTCTLVTCNAGFDNDQVSTQCQSTAANYYSPANDKTRTACPTAPPLSSPTGNTGLSSAGGCYNCDGGYLKNTASNTCDVPGQGKYVNVGGAEASCNPITIEGGATATWIAGAAATATACPFSCSAGFVKSGRACNIPGLGKYADNSGDEQMCNNPTGAAAGFDVFLPNMGAVDSATGCGFSCKSGFVKNTADRTCNIPDTGKYADSVGDEQSCNTPRGAATGFNTFLPNTAAVPTATGCDFSCNVGFVKKSVGRTCNIPDQGKYADNGVEKSCSPITGDTGGFNEFVVNTVAVSTATGCGFSCNTGFMKDSSGRECNFPSTGSFVNAQGTEALCGPITLEGAATATWIAGAAAAANTCPFFCSSGYVKNSLGRECKYPSTGSYADAQGNEASCNSITLEGTAIATWQKGAASTDTDCQFSCSGGYVADSSARECNYPTPGTYADAQGAEVSCTDITGITGFGAWVSGAATDQDSCPFSCSASYAVSGRTCNKSIPEMLALGQDTSHVLFSTGEVEAWGKVSTSPWRSHIKESLGGNTPQALAAGSFHQCIILKNGNLNHGRLMCWGQNGNDRLGVGDTNPRTTPTAVTAVGNDNDGNPNTVKSVSAGEYHTCAILNNDDTVVCWGYNGDGQIGGGSSLSATLSGSLGDPLNGGTATHIAAGVSHTCAVLTTDNSVQCWGYNDFWQTGGGTPNLGGSNTATQIVVGTDFSCAILNDGSVKCWGRISSPVLGSDTATQITAGDMHACALLNDKSVKCWGLTNAEGERGGGTSSPGRVLRGTLDDPLGGQTAIQIAAGYKHTCAVMESDHSVKCWGKNIDANDTGFYGQIVGGVAMTGGTDGTGTSMGETATLTAVSTPTATSLDSDANGKICKIELSGGTLGSPWVAKNYTTPLTYNTGGSTNISTAIDNMIAEIGSTVKLATTDVVLSKKRNFKIEATVNSAVFEGMTLTIFHDDNAGNCTSPVGTPITLSGASGGDKAEGLWVISQDYSGSGDKTINLDSVHLDLGNTALSKEDIADKIITKVTDGSWAGKQYKDLPYLATKLDGSSNTNDDCPTNDFCVVFNRLFKGTEGNYGIPFGDRDYAEAVSMTGGSDGTGTSTGETATLTAASTPTATALETDASGQICKIILSGGNLLSSVIVRDMTMGLLTYNSASGTNISTAIDNLIAAIGSPMNIAGTNVTLSKSGSDKIAATTDTAVFDRMTLAIQHANSSGDCTTNPVSTPINLIGGSGAAIATGLWVISHDFISGSGDKTINLDSVSIDLGNTDLSKEDIADKIVADVNDVGWAGTQYEDLPYTATKVQNSDNSDCPSSDYCVEFTRVFAGSEGNDGIPFVDRDYSH